MSRKPELHHLLDADLRLNRWPTREPYRILALDYLAAKIDERRVYDEPAINALLRYWHTFDDPALLRRELFERGYLARTRDGRRYWRDATRSC